MTGARLLGLFRVSLDRFFTLAAIRVSQQPISSPNLTAIRKSSLRSYPSGSPVKDGCSLTKTARSQPSQFFTLTATQVSQEPKSGPTLMAMRER